MNVSAYEGIAGTGKTTRLLSELSTIATDKPLGEHERVLALTFMHGARRRLHDRLQSVAPIRRRFDCSTFDSFSMRLCGRWRDLLGSMGREIPAEVDFEEMCGCAAMLLDNDSVGRWIRSGYAICVVDEAQDLTPVRLDVLKGLRNTGLRLLIAADEFQCLDPSLHENPCVNWLRQEHPPEGLEIVHRTDVRGLLVAAAKVREGGKLETNRPGFELAGIQGVPMAAVYVANAVAWHGGNTNVVLTPSTTGGFVDGVLTRVASGPVGRRQNGPFHFSWEQRQEHEIKGLVAELRLPEVGTSTELIEVLAKGTQQGVVRLMARWLERRRKALGVEQFTKAEVQTRMERLQAMHRAHVATRDIRYSAMTIHQAKNREFDNVVVLWPYTVVGSAGQKRRLLYNAITRARKFCTVIAQSPDLLDDPPFSPGD